MKSPSKKLFSIACAIAVGLGIIFFAWKGNLPASNKVSFEPTISGDLWRDSLSTLPQSHSSQVLGGETQNETGTEATTTSSIIAREMLTNYALLAKSRATTTLSDDDAQSLAQMLVAKIGVVKGAQYTAKDLAISTDNSSTATVAYSNKIVGVFKTFANSQTKSDLEIAFMDPQASSTEKSTLMKRDAARYEKVIHELLSMKTPSGIAPLHLRLVQTYSNIEAIVRGLADFYIDPLKGLATFAQYRKEIEGLLLLSKEYNDYLLKNQ